MLYEFLADRLAITPGQALFYAAHSKSEEAGVKSARNQMSAGTFPFKLTEIGGKKRVLVSDLLAAAGLGEGGPAPAVTTPQPPQPHEKRGRGRPRNLAVGGVK